MSFKHCPGIKDFVRPEEIIIRTCPSCSEEVEFFSDESERKCPGCGRMLHREANQSCVSWCEYAEKCINDLKERGLISQAKVDELKLIVKKKSKDERS